MTAFNFLAQFAPAVESGAKRCTIRVRGKRRPPVRGEALQLYTGMRTRFCRKLLDAVCMDTKPIIINADLREVVLDANRLCASEIEQLARADGFKNSDAFFGYHGRHGESLIGYLTQW